MLVEIYIKERGTLAAFAEKYGLTMGSVNVPGRALREMDGWPPLPRSLQSM